MRPSALGADVKRDPRFDPHICLDVARHIYFSRLTGSCGVFQARAGVPAPWSEA